MVNFKKLFRKINYFVISFLTMIAVSCAYFISTNNVTESHRFLFISYSNIHHDSHQNSSSQEFDHVHKHRHNDNEEEHTHKHLNVISFSEIVLNGTIYISFYPLETGSSVPISYNLKYYDSYFLKIFKPPMLS